MLNTTRPPLSTLALGDAAFTSSGLRHCARRAMNRLDQWRPDRHCEERSASLAMTGGELARLFLGVAQDDYHHRKPEAIAASVAGESAYETARKLLARRGLLFPANRLRFRQRERVWAFFEHATMRSKREMSMRYVNPVSVIPARVKGHAESRRGLGA
jgi:hypothetical protein